MVRSCSGKSFLEMSDAVRDMFLDANENGELDGMEMEGEINNDDNSVQLSSVGHCRILGLTTLNSLLQ